MSRLSFILIGTLLGCGEMGLVPFDDDTVYGTSDAHTPIDADMTGRTYVAWMDEIEVLEPAGLQALFESQTAGALLFHVLSEQDDGLELVIALSDVNGNQAPCEPVQSLPIAEWSTNPAFSIDEGRVALTVGGGPMEMNALEMHGVVEGDAQSWSDTTIFGQIDTRDLIGNSLPEGADVCNLVEEMGGACLPCPDGQPFCADFGMELQPREVDMDFNPNLSVSASGC